MKTKQRSGFTLMEVLIYTGILAIVGTIMSGVLFNATKIKGRETASIEVNDQLSFALESIQRAVADSSVIDITSGVSTSTLVLKFKNESQNPTLFYINNGVLYERVAANAPQPVTSNSVVANAINFLKISGYTGHDSVQVDLTLSYNTANSSQDFAFTRSLSSAIARVNAATFDSNLIPGSDQFYDIGQTSARWNNMYLSGNLGIGTTAPNGKLEVSHDGTSHDLVVDSTTGNIGIGTVSPFADLMVQKSSNIRIVGYTNNANGYVRYDWLGPSNNFGILFDHTNNILKIQNSLGAIPTGTDLVAVKNNGNVGIGTTAPNTRLQVFGTSNAPSGGNLGLISLGTTNEPTALQLGHYEGNYSWIQSVNSHPLYINAVGNNVIFNRDGGNVGIGTTNPSQKLDVAGSMNLGGYLIMPTGGYSIKLAGDNSGLTIVGASSNATGASISLLGHTNTMPDTITFNRSNGANSLESMRIDNNGNVGIGTTNPAGILQTVVNSGGNVQAEVFRGTNIFNRTTGGIRLFAGTDLSGGSLVFNAVPSFGGGGGTISSLTSEYGLGRGALAIESDSGNFRLHQVDSSGVYRQSLTVLTSGNVGIGTTAPTSKLVLGGDNGTAYGELGAIGWERTTYAPGQNAAEIQFWRNGAGQEGQIAFATRSTSNVLAERMRITDYGYVGIGTTNPSANLDVNGTVMVESGGSVNKVVCWKSDGKTLGYCSTVVASDGSCTCN